MTIQFGVNNYADWRKYAAAVVRQPNYISAKNVTISEKFCIFTADFTMKSRSVMPRLAVENLRNFQMLRKREHDGFTHKRGLFAISGNKVFSGPSTEEVVFQRHASC